MGSTSLTIWEILNRWSLNPIPDGQPPVSMEDVPVCAPNDQKVAEVSFADGPLFLPPDQVRMVRNDPETSSALPYINDALLGRLFAAFPQLRTGFNAYYTDGQSKGAFQRFTVCREDNPAAPPVGDQSPGYQLYISPMFAINKGSL